MWTPTFPPAHSSRQLPPPARTPSAQPHPSHHTTASPEGVRVRSSATFVKLLGPVGHHRCSLSVRLGSFGDQYDAHRAVWLGGVELLRTSTAEPTDSGIFWRVKKDVTKYRSVFEKPNNLSMMLENLVNEEFTGVYHCNLTVEFYPDDGDDDEGYVARRMNREVISLPKEKEMAGDDEPADLILPISNLSPENGYWFRIQNKSDDVHSMNVTIPMNAYRAVLEVYVSYHSNDEFWYSNPPDSYIEQNNLTTRRGNGAFRRVFATIDGKLVGAVVPFPVIFTGGINPLFWSPVVAIGAFNLPSYNLDITPFLGLLLDGDPHEFALNVTDGISFWLVDANLHLWLDSESTSVAAKLVQYIAPPLSISRTSKFFHLNGTFKIDTGSKFHFTGWVNSSFGNLTTDINHKLKFKHLLVFLKDGNYTEVHVKAKVKMGVRVIKPSGLLLSQRAHKYKYPLMIMSSTLAGENNTYTMNTSLSHTLYEENLSLHGDKVLSAKVLSDSQNADGWMLVQDHNVLSGSAATKQSYKYKSNEGCYNRKVTAEDGEILEDTKTTVCPPPPS
ncbi:peptide-N4-(N-acetyl-beta-glucosaminyl)asparagine amidase A-like [Asparagus officinalis]|nr:peptide-N4-(N-acetyl-beta-glucosaminyl)asparagine amidase A-like [Asparagus officinalis]